MQNTDLSLDWQSSLSLDFAKCIATNSLHLPTYGTPSEQAPHVCFFSPTLKTSSHHQRNASKHWDWRTCQSHAFQKTLRLQPKLMGTGKLSLMAYSQEQWSKIQFWQMSGSTIGRCGFNKRYTNGYSCLYRWNQKSLPTIDSPVVAFWSVMLHVICRSYTCTQRLWQRRPCSWRSPLH